MKSTKNIDRLFQEKFKDLEVSPPDIVWQNIEKQLNKKEERKRIIPLWFRYAGVAAILLLMTFSALHYFQKPVTNIPENTITNTEDAIDPKLDKNKFDESKIIENSTNDTNSKIVTTTDDSNTIKQTTNSGEVIKEPAIRNEPSTSFKNQSSKSEVIVATKNNSLSLKKRNIKNTVAKSNTSRSNNVALNPQTIKTKTVTVDSTFSKTTIATSTKIDAVSNTEKEVKKTKEEEEEEEAIAFQNIENLEDTLEDKISDDIKETNENINNRWTVASVFAPVYYNSFNDKGSPLDSQFENNSKEGSQSIAYGVKVGYQLNKKLSLQSGITVMNMGYTVNGVNVNPSSQTTSRLANVNYATNSDALFVGTSGQFNQEVDNLSNPQQSTISGDLNQEYGYIEVPMELKYSLINGKFGTHVIAGFSTLFLNNNNVSIETDKFSSDLGESNNLNTIDFSGNFGLDFDYKIKSNLFINVAPMLKIYTNTFSENSKNFKPYTIGVYTGLNYRF